MLLTKKQKWTNVTPKVAKQGSMLTYTKENKDEPRKGNNSSTIKFQRTSVSTLVIKICDAYQNPRSLLEPSQK